MSTTLKKSETSYQIPAEHPGKTKGRIMEIVSSISVEPTLFLTMFASIMYQLIVQNLYLEKACRVDIGFNQSVCDAMTIRNLSGYTQHEDIEVQKRVSQMLTLRTAIQGTFPLIVVIFAGSWSDRHSRRKPCILFPIVGEILCCVLLIVNTFFFYELPLLFTTLGDSIPFALLGGWPCLNSAIYSYIGTRYKNEDITTRVGIVTATYMASSLLGSSAGGFLYQILGFITFFSICIIMFTIAIALGYFLLEDGQMELSNERKVGVFEDMFNLKYIVGTFKTSFKSGPNKRRKKIIAVILSFLCVGGPFYGDISMNYIYTRLKFAWDAVQFGVFVSIQLLIQVLGSVISVVLFSRMLNWDDTFLGMVSIVGSASSNLIFAFASSGIYLYIGACCDIFLMASVIAVRSLMSKLVPPQELGQANAILALADAVVPMIYGPLYTTVYRYTIDIFSGTYLLVSVVIRLFGFSIFIWLYRQALQQRKRLKKMESKSILAVNDVQNISL